MPRKPLKIAPGGVVAELGGLNHLADPRIPMRERLPLPDGDEEQVLQRAEPRHYPNLLIGDDEEPERLPPPPLRRLPGAKGKLKGLVRVYHRTPGRKDLCWAFTITMAAFEKLSNGGSLEAKGATYPNGVAVVPTGVKPTDVNIRCGSCGTTSVACVELEFFTV